MTDRRYVNQRTGEVIDDPEIRPFAQVLADLAEGNADQEASEAFWDLTSLEFAPARVLWMPEGDQ